MGALRVAPKHGIDAVFGQSKLNKGGRKMCMSKKKQMKYRPKNLTKEEQNYLDAMVRREIIMSLITIILGIAIIIIMFALTKEVTGA